MCSPCSAPLPGFNCLIGICLRARTPYWFLIASFPLHPLLSWEPAAQPEWLQVMSDSEVEISSEQHWSCIAAGKPRPTIRWLRNGQPLTTQVTPRARAHTHTRTHSAALVNFLKNKYWSKSTVRFFFLFCSIDLEFNLPRSPFKVTIQAEKDLEIDKSETQFETLHSSSPL